MIITANRRKPRYEPKRTTLPFGLANLDTDTTFMAGRDDGLQCDEATRKQAYAKARAAGVNPTGKTYCPGLARLGVRHDPEAWINGKADVKRVCESRGHDCNGSVKVKARATDVEPESYHVADDLVENAVEKTIVQKDLRPTPKQRTELAEAAHEKLMPIGGTPC